MTDTAETMVERVAIAIGETISGYLDPADALIVADLSMSAARAAIAAMSLPAPATVLEKVGAAITDVLEGFGDADISAGLGALEGIKGVKFQDILASAAISALIQAALAEKPE